jgi:hypothetical protein
MFIVGVYLWFRNMHVGVWFVVIFSTISLGRAVYLPLRRCFDSPEETLNDDIKKLELLSEIELDQLYIDEKYEIFKVPFVSYEYVVRSSEIDSFLRSNQVQLEVNQKFLSPLNNNLQKNSNDLEKFLRCKYRKSWRNDPPKKFVNEKKVCLGGDLLNSETNILIYKASYFHSFLTNGIGTLALETGDSRSSQIKSSTPFYETNILKPVSESLMGNHIGVSTIVHTSDNKLVFWRQKDAAQESPKLMAPTGSGSCDWSDWLNLSGEHTLKNLVSRAMEREFMEESLSKTELENEGLEMKTKVLGYFRWIRRGGKPEFVGISKINIPHDKLKPNTEEVDKPQWLEFIYPAKTLCQLNSSLKTLLLDDRISVPLWVNLTCLIEVLEKEPDQWKAFLDI